MKITKTSSGYRVQASTQRENAVVSVLVALLQSSPEISPDERERHSEIADGPTWRNWAIVPERIWPEQLEAMAG
ncbi:hypothetical protein Mal15_38040 [Stieleria maiorica]|uniref:Uncharacterized protein n=1 Tax=Stieleria maiorica TaxID=2795974 RepID=A0A5B9MF56_9BACT|nr:hypothetical protein [Stieleria maiorica]QEF99738.1 hypothetical protein Mal15_38040 [Stieleria maiorica]